MVQAVGSSQEVQSSQPQSHIDQILEENGIPANGNPFLAFYFIIMVVMGQNQTQQQSENISKFASQLNALSSNLTAWESMKSDFYDSGDVHNDQTRAFIGSVGKLLNNVFGNYMKSHNIPAFPTNGYPLNYSDFEELCTDITDDSDNDPASLDTHFPVLGKHVVNLLQNLNGLEIFFTTKSGSINPQDTFSSLWENADGSVTPHGLPVPADIQKYADDLSEGAGLFSGVGGTESSILQMKQQQFNRLQSFVKTMLSDWVQQKKAFNSAMAQANS